MIVGEIFVIEKVESKPLWRTRIFFEKSTPRPKKAVVEEEEGQRDSDYSVCEGICFSEVICPL